MKFEDIEQSWSGYSKLVCECDVCQKIAKDVFVAGAHAFMHSMQEFAGANDGDLGPYIDRQTSLIHAHLAARSNNAPRH